MVEIISHLAFDLKKYLYFELILFFFLTKINVNCFENMITLKIKGPGPQYFLCKDNSYGYTYLGEYPSEIIVNNKKYRNNISNIIDVAEGINDIILKWNNNISNFSYMFFGCENIVEADLTNAGYYSNQTLNFQSMFSNCQSLTSIKLFDIYLDCEYCEINLINAFYNCINLISINLPNISSYRYYSYVNMSYMFTGCISLNSINISKILINDRNNKLSLK